MASSTADLQQRAACSWFAEQLAAAGRHAAVVERSAPAGHMPPLLRRDEPETYRVLDGEVTFFIGAEVVRAGRDDVIVCPAGVPRSFRAESDGAAWLVLTRVASHERFADFGRAVAPPLASPSEGWPSEAERASVASMGAANGIELLGPPGALPA